MREMRPFCKGLHVSEFRPETAGADGSRSTHPNRAVSNIQITVLIKHSDGGGCRHHSVLFTSL